MGINVKELKRMVTLEGIGRTIRHVERSLEKRWLKPKDFSIRDLFEALVVDEDGRSIGRSIWENWEPGRKANMQLLESTMSAIDSTAFLNISGQLFFSAIMDRYKAVTEPILNLVTVRPTKFSGEFVPGVGAIKEELEPIYEQMPYPEYGFGEDWVQTPRTEKWGGIVSVSKEAVFHDRTGLVLDRCRTIADTVALKQMKLILQVVLGLINNFKWRGTAYSTYQTAAPWINVKTSNGIVDWNQFDSAEQLFAEMTDPITGEPITLTDGDVSVLHMPARNHAFARVTKATEINYGTDQGGGAAAQTTRVTAPNTVQSYNRVSSMLAYRMLIAAGETATNAKDYWFIGDFKRAFEWQENWPLQLIPAQDNSEAEFTQDIVARWKATMKGSAAVRDPRYVVKNAQVTTI